MARKVKRRKPGIYLVRTRKHAGRNCHLGKCAHPNHTAKPWTDLDPRWHVLRLPWWLGWRWVLAPLEFIAIRVLLPGGIVMGIDTAAICRPQALAIREQYMAGSKIAAIAKRWHICEATVSAVIRGTHVTVRNLDLPNVSRGRGNRQ